jgi:hypothetical protein
MNTAVFNLSKICYLIEITEHTLKAQCTTGYFKFLRKTKRCLLSVIYSQSTNEIVHSFSL